MIESILEKSIAGQRLEPSEAVELFATKDILLLGNVASRLTRKKLKDNKNYILLENFPYDIKKLIQLININLLSKNFNKKSKIRIGNYNLDVNARNIVNNKIKLKLTEKEIDIILFLKKHQKNISIKEMQSQVWQYNKDLETHTVETHIHRLKKKFKSVFKDDDFIISFNGGYKIN